MTIMMLDSSTGTSMPKIGTVLLALRQVSKLIVDRAKDKPMLVCQKKGVEAWRIYFNLIHGYVVGLSPIGFAADKIRAEVMLNQFLTPLFDFGAKGTFVTLSSRDEKTLLVIYNGVFSRV